jgi:hypothetical protein
MTGWEHLQEELDAWHRAGRAATFWWRDDDAVRLTPALQRMLDLSITHTTPVALAVIPRDVEDQLATHLEACSLASVLQHGWSHDNHAPDGRQEEFGPHRPLPVMLEEIASGWRRLARFPRALPVFVAPWNRMDPHVAAHLPSAGLRGVSTLGPRTSAEAARGVRRVNVHIDIMDWQGTRGFVGLDRALDQILVHLRARRGGEADADEPTGLMTHHGFHDEACWAFVDALLQHTRAHPGLRWLSAEQAFWS